MSYDASKVLGKTYVGWDGRDYRADSYDPNAGYWMVDVKDPTNKKCISERAIGRTFHEVSPTLGVIYENG